jgi:hypothetical protein
MGRLNCHKPGSRLCRQLSFGPTPTPTRTFTPQLPWGLNSFIDTIHLSVSNSFCLSPDLDPDRDPDPDPENQIHTETQRQTVFQCSNALPWGWRSSHSASPCQRRDTRPTSTARTAPATRCAAETRPNPRSAPRRSRCRTCAPAKIPGIKTRSKTRDENRYEASEISAENAWSTLLNEKTVGTQSRKLDPNVRLGIGQTSWIPRCKLLFLMRQTSIHESLCDRS